MRTLKVSRKLLSKPTTPSRLFSDRIQNHYKDGHRNVKFESLGSFSYIDTKELEDLSDIDYKPVAIDVVDKILWQTTKFISRFVNWVFSYVGRDDYASLVYETMLAPNRNVSGILRRFPAFQSQSKHADLMEFEENEKMHNYVWLDYVKPNVFVSIILLILNYSALQGQFIFSVIAPRTTKKWYTYLQYRTIKHYSRVIETGKFQKQVLPESARQYWRLGPDATMHDLLLVIRADKIHQSMNTAMTKEIKE
jgi:hypothetical protein